MGWQEGEEEGEGDEKRSLEERNNDELGVIGRVKGILQLLYYI